MSRIRLTWRNCKINEYLPSSLPIYIHTHVHILQHLIISAVLKSGTSRLFLTSLSGDSDALTGNRTTDIIKDIHFTDGMSEAQNKILPNYWQSLYSVYYSSNTSMTQGNICIIAQASFIFDDMVKFQAP